jgi:hypothetical protein
MEISCMDLTDSFKLKFLHFVLLVFKPSGTILLLKIKTYFQCLYIICIKEIKKENGAIIQVQNLIP